MAIEQTRNPERLVYRVKEAAATLAMSRSRFYELVAAGEIRILKDGARTLVRHSELEAYLDRLDRSGAVLRPISEATVRATRP